MTSCKEKIAIAPPSPHSAVTHDRTCMNCHAPHASNVGKLLNEAAGRHGCLKCHDKAIKTEPRLHGRGRAGSRRSQARSSTARSRMASAAAAMMSTAAARDCC